jgi:subtilisin family serine protease
VCAVSKFVTGCSNRSSGHTYGVTGSQDTGHTSAAAPRVAGTVALIRSVNSFLTPAQIEQLIKDSSDVTADAHRFPDSLPGVKRSVNAYRAVRGAKMMACNTTNTFSKTIATINESVNGGHIIISNTTVRTGKRLSVSACNSVTINGPFLAEAGSMLNINMTPYP